MRAFLRNWTPAFAGATNRAVHKYLRRKVARFWRRFASKIGYFAPQVFGASKKMRRFHIQLRIREWRDFFNRFETKKR
jgi:hypothetical protein